MVEERKGEERGFVCGVCVIYSKGNKMIMVNKIITKLNVCVCMSVGVYMGRIKSEGDYSIRSWNHRELLAFFSWIFLIFEGVQKNKQRRRLGIRRIKKKQNRLIDRSIDL
jgi:hypothetical protein